MAIDPSSFFLYSSTDFKIFKSIFEIFYSIMSNFYIFWIINAIFFGFQYSFKRAELLIFYLKKNWGDDFFIPNMMIYGDFSIFHQNYIQKPLRFFVPFLNSVKILLKVEILQYYIRIDASSFFRYYPYIFYTFIWFLFQIWSGEFLLFSQISARSFFRFNSFLQIHIIELTFEIMAIYSRSLLILYNFQMFY